MVQLATEVETLTIGKGQVYIKTAADATRRAVGNCPEFEFTPTIEKLEHFDSQSGIKSRDRTVVVSKSGTLRIVFESMVAENVRLALLGAISDLSGTDQSIDIFSESAITAEVWFDGNNDVGPKWNYYFPRVDFIPSGGINLISEEWLSCEITGDVQKVGTSFGTAQLVAPGA